METEQLSIFDIGHLEPIKESDGRQETIEEKFWRFHALNPHVEVALRRMALQLKDSGHSRYGLRALFEVLRFKSSIDTTGRQFKLNNNYTSFYARLIMDLEPALIGFFQIREHEKESENGQI